MTPIRTLGLFLYFLLTSNGYTSDVDTIGDMCGGSMDANSSEALIDISESYFSDFSTKSSKTSKKRSKKGFGQHFLLGNSQMAFAVLIDDYRAEAIESRPKIDDSYKEHTFYNNLFFPPDEDSLV